MDINEYKTLKNNVQATIYEKKSEFIANAAPVENEDGALDFLNSIKKEHRTATHNVYAYCLREGNRQRYSDDGEPAKTAGLPVLDVIGYAGLSDVIIVVTRYFGGTLLGTGGLVRAYSAAAKAALDMAEIVTLKECVRLNISLDYSFYESACRILEEANAVTENSNFADKVNIEVIILLPLEEELREKLSEMSRGTAVIETGESFYYPC